MMFEYVGGKETGIQILKALSGRTEMRTQLFATKGTYFPSNLKS
jgi:hypothetical protein